MRAEREAAEERRKLMWDEALQNHQEQGADQAAQQ